MFSARGKAERESMLTAPGDRAESSLKTEILLVGRPELTFFSLYWALAIQFSPERTRDSVFTRGKDRLSRNNTLLYRHTRAHNLLTYELVM